MTAQGRTAASALRGAEQTIRPQARTGASPHIQARYGGAQPPMGRPLTRPRLYCLQGDSHFAEDMRDPAIIRMTMAPSGQNPGPPPPQCPSAPGIGTMLWAGLGITRLGPQEDPAQDWPPCTLPSSPRDLPQPFPGGPELLTQRAGTGWPGGRVPSQVCVSPSQRNGGATAPSHP